MFCALIVLAGCGTWDGGPGEPPRLTEAHDCGYGFYLGNVDQTRALKITFQDFEAAQAGEVPEQSALSDDVWSAELEGGQDLFANWCDDVLEPDEPTPEVREVWQVSGAIEIAELPPAGECGPAAATLTGLEAHNDEGEIISLGDLEIENEFWGCIAG